MIYSYTRNYLKSIITWSEMGQQNAQSKKVYSFIVSRSQTRGKSAVSELYQGITYFKNRKNGELIVKASKRHFSIVVPQVDGEVFF